MVFKTIAIVSLVLCLITIVLLIFKVLNIKKKYSVDSLHTFVEDKLIREKVLAKSNNKMFATTGKSSEVVDRYILSYEKRKCMLLCNYVKEYNDVMMKVLAYDENEKLIGVYKVKEHGHLNHSSIINLPAKCMYVNIVIDEDVNYDGSIILNKKFKDYKIVVQIETLALFFGLIFAAYITADIIGGNILYDYFSTQGLFISIISITLVCLINYIVILKLLRKEMC